MTYGVFAKRRSNVTFLSVLHVRLWISRQGVPVGLAPPAQTGQVRDG